MRNLALTPNEYQQRAVGFAIYPDSYSVVYPALGLAGEAGEVSEKVKKIVRANALIPTGITAEQRVAILKELGDVAWYLANLADDLGFTLEEVLQENLNKLEDRADRGVIQGDGDNR